MIELEQYAVTNLAAGATVHTLKEIDSDRLWYSCFSCDEPKDDNCIFLKDRFCNFGLGSPVIFQDEEEDTFILNLITQVSEKHWGGLHQDQAWVPHRIFNLQMSGRRQGCQFYEGGAILIQGHKLEMPKMCDFGFIQFYALPEYCRLEGNLYSAHELVTFYVYRHHKIRDKMVYPPVVNLGAPTDAQTYVALLPGQRFQLFAPDTANVETSGLINIDFRPSEERTLVGGKKVKVMMATCKKVPEYSESIQIFQKVDKFRKCNTLTFCPLLDEDGLYMIMSEPIDKGLVILNQYVAGIRITTDNPESYVADERYIEIDIDGDELILRFTNPLKNITLDRSHGLWWIDHRPNLPLDRLP